MYASTTIMNSIIERNPGRTLLGYMKLTYLAHGWSLANARPVVSELPVVQPNGALHEDALQAANHLRGHKIHHPFARPGANAPVVVPESDVETCRFLDELVSTYLGVEDLGLSSLCSAPGTPFRIIWDARKVDKRLGSVITDDETLAYFGTKMREHEENMRKEAEAIERLVAEQAVAAPQSR